MNNQFQEYHEAVQYLESFINLSEIKIHAPEKDAGIFIKRTNYVLNIFHNPQNNLKIVHVTGTSGKGTVSDLVHQYLLKNGKKAGLFTSPFATTSIEKIKVGERFIEPLEFAAIVEELKPVIDQMYASGPFGAPTYFELFFIIAVLYFARQKCEWAVIEVGMGGRFDATNAIKSPAVCAITNIDYDHTAILGKTLTKIAVEKAGIAKKGVALLTAETRPHLLRIIKKEAEKVGVKKFSIIKTGHNAAEKNQNLAKAIAVEIGLKTDFKIASNLPCRFEKVQENPIVILDGAHNPAKIKNAILGLAKFNYKKSILVVGMSEDKDVDSALSSLKNKFDFIFATRFLNVHRKAASPKKIATIFKDDKKVKQTQIFLDPFAALQEAIKKASKDGLVLVIGSFFLAGDLRKNWVSEEQILRQRKS